MIVTVKKSKKKRVIKFLSLVFLAGMFLAYYYYQSYNFQQQEIENQKKLEAKKIEDEKNKLNSKIEKAIVLEIEKAVDLIGQENVNYVKIIENKAVIVCKKEVNLDALMVRYGALALIKKTLKETIIALDIASIADGIVNAK